MGITCIASNQKVLRKITLDQLYHVHMEISLRLEIITSNKKDLYG